MGKIEIRERRVTEGLVALGTGVCVAVALGLLVSTRGALNQPSHQELARQEAAARQQADLDTAWRPWITGAENLMVVSLCVTVSCGIGGLGLFSVRLLVRRWRPLEGQSMRTQELRGHRQQPQRPERTGPAPAATRPRSDQRRPQSLDMAPLHAGAGKATGQGAATIPPEPGELWWPTVA